MRTGGGDDRSGGEHLLRPLTKHGSTPLRTRTILLAAALAGSVAFAPAAFTAAAGDDDPGVGSSNFTLVENLPHSGGGRGSDIEFATLSYADADAAAAAGYANPGADALPDEPGIQKDIALAGTTGTQFYLYDVTTPEAVYETAAYECPANQGDTQVFTREAEDGTVRTFTTYTVEDGGSAVSPSVRCGVDAGLSPVGANEGAGWTGTFIIELTDPFAPAAVAFIPVEEGSHNGTVHPSGNYFYNSNSSLVTEIATRNPGIEYYDISDFENIERLGKLELPFVPLSLGSESHDITFDAAGDRAYSAALSQGVIIDTSDPANPTIISNFVDPTIQVWHQSDPIDVGDRRFLVIEDEVAGATGTGQCPNGGVHVYEVTPGTDLETVPLKVGYWNIDEARVMATEGGDTPVAPSCTAHVFRLYPESNLMTISYYNGGVRVVDLGGLEGVSLGAQGVTTSSDLEAPLLQIGWRRFDNSNSWAAKAPRITVDDDGNVEDFTVFSNGGRGLDVLAFDADDAAGAAEAARSSQWLSPREAELELGTVQLSPGELRSNLSPYSCLL